jgi:HPt (histidine-containing phosphotransfer) domain-containing protein
MSDTPRPADAPALLAALRAHVTDLIGEDDPDFVAELSETFCSSATDLVSRARDAHAAGDADTLKSVAHQMRGSALNVGLADLAEAWAHVEHTPGASPAAALAEASRAIAALNC